MGKNDIISIDKVEYQKWLQNLFDEIDRQRLKAVMQLNASTLQHYWWLGNDILKKQEAQGWGAKVIDMLSAASNLSPLLSLTRLFKLRVKYPA